MVNPVILFSVVLASGVVALAGQLLVLRTVAIGSEKPRDTPPGIGVGQATLGLVVMMYLTMAWGVRQGPVAFWLSIAATCAVGLILSVAVAIADAWRRSRDRMHE